MLPIKAYFQASACLILYAVPGTLLLTSREYQAASMYCISSELFWLVHTDGQSGKVCISPKGHTHTLPSTYVM